MKSILFNVFITICSIAILLGCSSVPKEYSPSSERLKIYPDYSEIVIPPNIAPLNFKIENAENHYLVRLSNSKGRSLSLKANDGKVIIPKSKWKRLLDEDKGGKLLYQVYCKKNNQSWEKFEDFSNSIAKEDIDGYVAFRKITQVHILWKKMGIYQRSLENFRERPIMTNDLTDVNCMNCHTFNQGNPDEVMFHMRAKYGGTFIQSGKDKNFVNTKSDHTRAAGAYASWHPEGDLIAFSVNDVHQSFLSTIGEYLFVYDRHSDIILYDIRENSVSRPGILATEDMQNLPTWSPDGNVLYYISTEKLDPSGNYTDTKYDLISIEFNKTLKTFSNPDTLIRNADFGHSITFPRPSPSGKYISFIGVDHGYFSINNREADIYLYDIESRKINKPDINSSLTESYPSWSSNGSWLMFVSKREDGDLSQPWFSHIDEAGVASKPFVLPQKDPDFYDDYIFNYNRPEFIKGKVDLRPRKVFSLAKDGAKSSYFNEAGSASLSTGATVVKREIENEGFYSHD